MNASFSKSNPAAEEAAALWAARLDGSDLSISDRAELNIWLAADPAHRGLLSSYCQFSADLEKPLATLVEAGAVQMPSASRTPSQQRSRLKLFTGSAIAAIAAAIMLAVWIAQPQTQFNEIATAIAQRQSITLSDGTKVDLNAHTHLEVAISTSERRVRLAAGEAFFEVQKDPARPFIIETPAGSVRVTGTTFNVRSEAASSLEVTVVEGAVQVRTGGEDSSSGPPVSLGAGDKLSSGPTGVSVKALSDAAIADTLAWREGQIVFDGVPLWQALARFSRYHGRTMSVADEVAELQVGGRYSLDDPSGFFAALEEFFPVKVTSESDGNVRIISREER
jgi:transmembrane sensor